MTSIVSVCNRALSKIGDELIIMSLDDETKPARYCKALYDDTRDFVLRSYPWRFALKRLYFGAVKRKTFVRIRLSVCCAVRLSARLENTGTATLSGGRTVYSG